MCLKSRGWIFIQSSFILLLSVIVSVDSDTTCPAKFGYFPDPSDCQGYYICTFGNAKTRKCGNGLHYKTTTQTCDTPKPDNCAQEGDQATRSKYNGPMMKVSEKGSEVAVTPAVAAPPAPITQPAADEQQQNMATQASVLQQYPVNQGPNVNSNQDNSQPAEPAIPHYTQPGGPLGKGQTSQSQNNNKNKNFPGLGVKSQTSPPSSGYDIGLAPTTVSYRANNPSANVKLGTKSYQDEYIQKLQTPKPAQAETANYKSPPSQGPSNPKNEKSDAVRNAYNSKPSFGKKKSPPVPSPTAPPVIDAPEQPNMPPEGYNNNNDPTSQQPGPAAYLPPAPPAKVRGPQVSPPKNVPDRSQPPNLPKPAPKKPAYLNQNQNSQDGNPRGWPVPDQNANDNNWQNNQQNGGADQYGNPPPTDEMPPVDQPPAIPKPFLKPAKPAGSPARKGPANPPPDYPPTDMVTVQCNAEMCQLPNCQCGGTAIPGGLQLGDVPQMIILSFDAEINERNLPIYEQVFHKNRKNPNGCNTKATFFVSHEFTNYGMVRYLYEKGHEIGSHSITHGVGTGFKDEKSWETEMSGQKGFLASFAAVRPDDIKGARAPLLGSGGDNQFEALDRGGFLYDSTLAIPTSSKAPFWPYTLDFGTPHSCVMPPCPQRSYKGLWELPLNPIYGLFGENCYEADRCTFGSTGDEVYKLLYSNFNDRHYMVNKAPFQLAIHADWLKYPPHREAFERFLDFAASLPDVWVVTGAQAVAWMQNPTPVSQLPTFAPWQCSADDASRLPQCDTINACPLPFRDRLRYFYTCSSCPAEFPWRPEM